MRLFRLIPLAVLVALAMTHADPAGAAAGFASIAVIGDSLSDGGNAGRFSDGPVWVERLAAALGLTLAPSQAGGTNFAVGGARLDPGSGPTSLRAQADRLLAGPPAPGRRLYVLWGGGNDLLAALGRPDAEATVDAAAASLRGIALDLVAAGVTDLLIANLPDIGIAPAVQDHGAAAVAAARGLSARFDDAVAAVWRDVEDAGAGHVRLYRLDVRALAERVRADPQAYGFTEIRRPCPGPGACDGYLFWDGIHPTAQAHARLGTAALRVLDGTGDRP